ncbi:MAG: class I SAM-dependent methyltransferase [Bryobacterales bacterium]|nr:class I SAM-dependent methyltransferase [Bryobacterales bacterium]
MSFGEALLRALSRDPKAEDYPGGTARTNIDNALDFMLKTVPNFVELVRGKDVLDFGCGMGLQAAALARSYAKSVTGVDLPREFILSAWARVQSLGLPNLTLTTGLAPGSQFDLVYSCSAFEHFGDPAAILEQMRQHTRPGGHIVITFAEPWLSPRGAHVDNFTRLPWVNVFFSEKTVMKVRSLYRSDGARRYEDVEGGLNRMTLAKFGKILHSSGLRIHCISYYPVKGLPLVSRIPLVREFLTAAASCVLEKR